MSSNFDHQRKAPEAKRSINVDFTALERLGYKMLQRIGKGSYASVMTADYSDQRNKTMSLACKIVDKKSAPPDFLEHFFPREISIITKIDHPCIIKIHSILKRGPRIFIFMRYAEKGDLLNYIKQHGSIPEKLAREWLYQIVKGLQYLHSLSIAHRDLKCENILITKRMSIKIADFGFASYCSEEDEKNKFSQTYCGSAAYAAPEVVSGQPYDPKKSDIWSLGIILFIMVNSSMPFDDTNLNRLIQDQMHHNYIYNSKKERLISTECKHLISSLLEPNVDQRWTIEQILNCKWFTQDADFKVKYYVHHVEGN